MDERTAWQDGHGHEHVVVKPEILYFGTPVVLVTTANRDGMTNISPMSSAFALADRIVLGMFSRGQGLENALRTGQLVVNVPAPGMWEKVEELARLTGRRSVPAHKQAIGYRFAADKFAAAGLTPQPSDLVKPERILECPLQFETEVVGAHAPAGDWPEKHPEPFRIVETRVLRVHAHRRIVVPGTNHIDPTRWGPLLYVFRHYFATGRRLGQTFKAAFRLDM